MKRGVVTGLSAAVVALLTALLGACDSSGSSSSGSSSQAGTSKIAVAATINAWGSILAQLGGDKVTATSLITNPDTDPHDYEPTPADARVIASSAVFVQNGIGYDSWAAKSLQANPNPNRQVVTVGDVVGVKDGGNPHQWYSPESVAATAAAITAALKKADPSQSQYFDAQLTKFDSEALGEYHRIINEIKSKYSGTPVGASESIFAPLSSALGLNLVTPASFLDAISEGTDPTAADKATVDRQIAERQIKVYVYNSQNSTPDVQAQVDLAKKQNIPVVSVTETLSPANASFQSWQVAQLKALQSALAQATGK